MKKINLIALFAIIAFLFSSCDKLEGPYEREGNGEDPSPTPVETTRKVLLEEFTGHKCVNCPTAHEVAAEIYEEYDAKVIILAFHAGYYSQPDPSGGFPADYRTPEGDKLNGDFGVQTVPVALINRSDDGGLKYMDSWREEVAKELAKEADAKIGLSVDFQNGNKKIVADVDVTFLKEIEGNYNLCVFVTESGMISPQKNNNEEIGGDEIEDYEHKHVMRGSMNGAYGVTINSDPVTIATPYKFNYTYDVNADYNMDNMSVIAFIINQETKEVIQVEEVKAK